MLSDNLLLDLHVHSHYSRDSIISFKNLARNIEKTGVVPLICDHDSILGSQLFAELLKEIKPDFPIIFSEEITTCDGEIIGVFLNEDIPGLLTVGETLDQIADQGGLSIVPHPFDRYRKKALDSEILDEFIGRISLIEAYNGRTLNKQDNLKASHYAKEHNKYITAGSDAHTPYELGKTYVEIAPFDEPQEFIQQLKNAKIFFKQANPGVHAITKILKVIRS